MIITYHGAASFKVQFGDTVLAFNPVSKRSEQYKPTRYRADIALVSARHPDLNGVEQVRSEQKELFVASGPGEYEVNGVTIQGYLSHSEYGLPADSEARAGSTRMNNTIFVVELEGMTLCFLGVLSDPEIAQETRQALEGIDLLFLPIGGNGMLEATAAYKLAVGLEPRVIIPAFYGEDSQLKRFLEEGGVEKVESQDKLTLKQKEVAGLEGEIMVLKPQ